MPANEFEKKLQQKMEGLNLAPSEEVWLEVERRIRKEKKRRRFIIWFFLFGALALGGGFALTKWGINHKNDKSVLKNNNTSKVNPVLDPIEEKSSITIPRDTNNFSKSSVVKNKTAKYEILKNSKEVKALPDNLHKNLFSENKLTKSIRNPEPKQNNKPEFINRVAKNSFTNKEKDISLVQIKKEGQNNNEQLTDNSTSKDIVSIGQNDKQVEQEFPSGNKDSSGNNEIQHVQVAIENKDSSRANPEKLQIQANESVKDSAIIIASENKPSIQIKKKPKWRLGFFVQGGRSNISEKFNLGFNDALNTRIDALSASPASGPPTPVYSSSSIRSSGSLALGIFVRRPLSPRFDADFGFSYSNLSTKRNVGSYTDTPTVISNPLSSSFFIVNNFYSAANTNSSYTNHYHFIRLSAEISLKLIKGKSIIFSWNNGFSYERLISSNMLHFSQSLPGYYKNFDLLAKNHLFFTTGLSVSVLQKFTVKAFTESSLTQVLNYKSSTKAYYTNYGVGVNFLFDKK